MQNVLRVFTRDARQLRSPIALLILGGLIVLPCLYAWLNIIAFWDPYSDTKAIRVDVVNLDKGGSSSATGQINVGDQIVAQLKDNHDIGWQFVDKETAISEVQSGNSYAAIVVPETFSSNLLTIMSGKFIQPQLDYYTNEKANPIAPKITDAAASQVQTQVNNTFVSTVAQTLAEALQKAGDSAKGRLTESQSQALLTINQATSDVGVARDAVKQTNASIDQGQVALGSAKDALTQAQSTTVQMQSAIATTQSLVSDIQQELVTFTDLATRTYTASAAQLSSLSSQVNGVIGQVGSGAAQANAQVGASINFVDSIVASNAQAIKTLQAYVGQLDPQSPAYAQVNGILQQLQARQDADQQLLSSLKSLNTNTAGAITALQSASSAFNTAVQQSAGSAGPVRDALVRYLPELNQAMSAMTSSASAFSSSLGTQRTVLAQAVTLLASLDTQLTSTKTALTSLDGDLASAGEGLQRLSGDVQALDGALVWKDLNSLTGLQPQRIAEFMVSPVTVDQKTLFPVPNYGSAMAPLFTNLALWIGAFVLVVLIRQEVATDGIPGLTVRQAYFGRWMLLAVLNFLQAVLVTVGNIVIGVHLVNAPIFVFTGVFVGAVYLAIIYALAVSFGYVGKGIVILLVIMQIPGASGIYPIQMMPGFFQKLFPFFPFAHGIDAMREVVGGFYDHYYLQALGILLIFAALSIVVGIFARQRLGGFARLFNRSLDASGLFVSEDVQILGSRRRVRQIVRAISDPERFKKEAAERAAWAKGREQLLNRIIVAAGLALTLVLLAVATLVPDLKATVLGLWALVFLLVAAALVGLEYVRQGVDYAATVGDMETSTLEQQLRKELAATHSDTPLSEIAETGETHPTELETTR